MTGSSTPCGTGFSEILNASFQVGKAKLKLGNQLVLTRHHVVELSKEVILKSKTAFQFFQAIDGISRFSHLGIYQQAKARSRHYCS